MSIDDILSNPYLGPLIAAGLSALGALVARVLLEQWRRLRHELSAEQVAMVERLATIATRWVEQTTVPGTPADQKLDEAIAFVSEQAHLRGIPVDAAMIHAAVEAAVLGLTNPASVPANGG